MAASSHSPNCRGSRAFSSEVGPGSRKENASKQKTRASRSDSIGTEVLGLSPVAFTRPCGARARDAWSPPP
ncbi:MAG: hypothetical protein E8A46_11375 [Bradyrhizobium sp.]|nr:MAG: hypothetical protein E8A46_11375 [Bradyrhizobium sp.]